MKVSVEAVRALEPFRFEQLIAELLELSGFHNVVSFGGTGDEGIDIRAEWLEHLPTGDVLASLWAVQCKRYSKPIGPKHIESILNVVLEPPRDLLPAPPDFFLLATSSSLTVNARRVVDRANSNRQKYSCRFVIWDGEAILKRIEPHELVLSKFFAPAAIRLPSTGAEQPSMLRLSILLDSVDDDLIVTFLCESELVMPMCQHSRTRISRAEFEELVRQCRELSARPYVTAFDGPREELLRRVGGLIHALIPAEIQLTLRQHGDGYLRIASNMHVVPFELAWDADGYGFLGSAKRVGRIQVADVPTRLPPVPQPSILLIGAADHAAFSLLPNSAEELREISALLSSQGISATLLTGPEVTLSKITELLATKRYQMIHFAGHGVFDAPPREAGLAFSEGLVSFEDITRGDFGGALVFLSSCSSGAALDDASRKYFQSGAVGLVGFVGPVTDRAANLIATHFYRHIAAGATLGDALRAARNAQKRQLPDDYSWVSLVLFGDPSRRLRDVQEIEAASDVVPSGA